MELCLHSDRSVFLHIQYVNLTKLRTISSDLCLFAAISISLLGQ